MSRSFSGLVASLLAFCGAFSVIVRAQPGKDEITVVQISDTHIGEQHAPHAAKNLQQAVDMINSRHPDAVILSGDIGENPRGWDEAKSFLKKLKSPLYYVPG